MYLRSHSVQKGLFLMSTLEKGTKNEDIETTSKSHSMDDPVLELDKMCVNDNFVFSDDCSAVFWKCSNGVAHSFKCPSGLVFNKETGSCGFADEVDSCSKKFDEFRRAQTFRRLSSNVAGEKLAKEFSYDVMTFERYCDSKDVGVYSFSNCSSRYYVCGKNSFNIAKCPLSYMFNPETRRCESSTEFTCTPDRKDHDGKLKGGNFTCDGKADGYYGFGGFYKDFYGCLNGELFYYSCERGLYFNPVSQYCEHFRNDDNPKETGLSRYDSYKKKNKTEFDCSRVPHGLYSFGCSPVYFSCESDQTVMKRCSLGHVFNQKTLACASFTECQATIKEVELEVVVHGVRCSNESEYKTFGCKPYYIYCCNGEQYLQYCASGEIFDPQLGVCTSDHLCNVYDDHHDVPETTTMAPVVPRCLPRERSPIGQCMPEYLECNEEGNFVKYACDDGKLFDHQRGFCRPSEECDKKIANDNQDEEKCTPGKTSSIMSCHNFYFLCNELGKQSILQCSNGTLYDENFGYCRPENVCGKVIDTKPSSKTTPQPRTHKMKECKTGEVMVIVECGKTYTECNEEESFQIRMCPEGTGFDSRESKCVSLHRCGKTLANDTVLRSTEATTVDEHEVLCKPGELDIIYECSPNYLLCNEKSQFTIHHCGDGFRFDGTRNMCLPEKVCGKLTSPTAPPKMQCKPGHTYSKIDCDKGYFHCSSHGQYEYIECTGNFVFSSQIKQCVEKSFCARITTTTASAPTEKCRDGEILVIDDCFQKYSECNKNGEYKIKKCKKGYVFDGKKMRCVKEKLCGLMDTSSLVLPTTMKPTKSGELDMCTPGTYEIIDKCFQQFLHCNDLGRIEVKSCPKGFVFELSYGGCVDEYICEKKEAGDVTVAVPTSTPYTTTYRTTTVVAENTSNKCVPRTFEIIDVCFRQFLECNNQGKFEVKSCPEGFVFDIKYNGCVDKYICDSKVAEETTALPSSTKSYTTTSRVTIAPVAEDQSQKCAPRTLEIVGECFQQFLECNDEGEFEVKNCPEGFVFDMKYHGCIDKYICGNTIVDETTVIPPSTIPPYTTTSRTTKKVVSGDSSDKCLPDTIEVIDECFQQFLQCNQDGKFEIKSCPEGFVFEAKYNGCVDRYTCGHKEVEGTTVVPSPTKGYTTTSKTIKTPVSEDQTSKCAPGTFEVIGECFQQFLECDDEGKFEVKNCPEEFVFDTKYNGCVEKYACGNKVVEETTVIPPSTIPPYTTTSRTMTTTTVSGSHSDKCVPGSFEIIDECFQQFLECNDEGEFEVKNCPGGFVFDTKYNGCVEKYACGNKVVEETTVIPPSTIAPYTTTSRTTIKPVSKDQTSKCTPGTFEVIGECFQQFLECNDDGIFEVKNCPKEFAFDTRFNGCVDKYACGNKVVEETTVIPPSTIPPYTTTSRTMTTTTVSGSHSDKCVPGSFEIIDECFQQFLECNEDGKFGIKNCPEGFVFDTKYNGCVDEYICTRKVVEETTVIPPSTIPPYTKPSATTSRTTTTAVPMDQSSKCAPGTLDIIGECFQQFLECDEYGMFGVKNCPEGFVFDTKYNGCVELYVCGNKVIEETTVIPPSTLPLYTKPSATTSRTTTTTVASDHSDKCAPGSFEIIDECFQQFLECNEYGMFGIKNCPEGFVFDRKYSGCVESYVCGREVTEETTVIPPSTLPPYVKPYTTTSRITTTTVSSDHSDRCVSGTFETVGECFQQFLECNEYGIFRIKNCPEGFVFDKKYSGCVESYVCGHEVIEETTVIPPSTLPPYTKPYTTTSRITTTTVANDQNGKCDPKSIDIVGECSRQFLQCSDYGEFEVRECPEGFVFSPKYFGCVELHICRNEEVEETTTVLPSYTKPYTKPYSKDYTTTSRTTTTIPHDDFDVCVPGTYEAIDKCFQQFLECNHYGKFEIKKCPEGFVFDTKYNGCVDGYICDHQAYEGTTTTVPYTTTEKNLLKCVPGTHELIDECSQQYLECNYMGKIEVKSCPRGFVFDLESRGCIDDHLCNDNGPDYTTTATTTLPPQVTQETTYGYVEPTTSKESYLQECRNGEIKEIGSCHSAFLFCDLSSKFVVRNCGYGKVFDETKSICVNSNDCGVEPSYSTSTIRAPTCKTGDLMVTSNCMTSYFECNEDNVFEVKHCYGDGVFDESRNTCVDRNVCGRGQDVVTQPPIKDCNMGSFVEIDECSQEYAECNEYSKYVIRSCQSNYVFSAKSNSCILKEDCGSEPTTAQAPITATAECTVGSFKEISPCSNSYLKCDETGVYVYTNCESDFVFDRNTLSCVSSQKCKGNDVGYGTDSSTGYGTDSGTGYGADSSTGYESRRPYNWYENHKPTPIGPETDDVVDRFGFIDPYPHDLHSIAHTYPSKEELEGEGVKDDFSVNTIIPKRYVSPYDMNNDVDDLNLYEPVLSMGPLRSGYPDLPDHDNHDFVLDDFLGDTNDHFDRHFGYRTNYMDEVKEDFVMDRFLDTSDALHHDLGHYYPGHISDDGNHYQADEFVLPPDVDSHHKFGHHHPGGHNEHYQYGEPHYNNYDLNNNVVYDHEFIGNYRTKRSTDGEQSVGPDNFSTQSSNKSNYHFIFEHSTNSIRCLKDFCNRTVNNLAPIGFCTEEFINCTNLDDVFVQRCGDRNVFDGKTGECISYDVCLNSKPVQLARSLMFDEDVLDDNVCVELGDGIYYKDGCGKYFVVCNKNRMNHMHCPRDMYFDVNRFQCDYIENVDACKYTSFNGGEVHSTDSMSRFNCKNVPNGFIGHECSNTFAYCQNEVVRRKFRCPRNHVFDSTSRLCVLPEMVPACDNNPMFADPRCLSNPNRAFGSHCSSVIHHCLNGRHYTYPCGENKLLNNITMRCLPVGELKECENMDKLRLLGSEVENYCKVGEIRNMAIEPCNTEYIKCLKSGQQLYVKCEDGLVYDEQDDNCTQSDLCIVKYSLNVTNADTTEVPSYIERDKSLLVVVDPVCEGKGENEFVPTGACKKEYIECIKTTAVRRSCPNNYIFSKEKNSCVYKFTSMECELPKFNDQEEFKDTNDVPPFDAAKFCVGKENRFYRNPQNCTIAVRCYEEKTHAMYSCARGLVYDEDNQKCDYAQKFKRCIGSDVTTPAVNISTDVECTIANHGLFIPDASDCSKYYRCVWGTLIERKCPQTTKFNPKFSVCDFPITPDSCEFR
uniref:Chitin-binding type-2 domain-containing protein n=1 Tax=Strongyloides papillosus TaxID=174720 RepID=A0A0N5C352_STREA